MSRPAPGGPGRAVDRLLEGLGVPAEARARFGEGLLLGAMVGAAIAGSTLWNRIRADRGAAPPAGDAPADPGTDSPPPSG
jgi:hypothetical protein